MDGEIKVTAEGWETGAGLGAALVVRPCPPPLSGASWPCAPARRDLPLPCHAALAHTHVRSPFRDTPTPRRCLRWARRHLCGCWSQGPSPGEVPRTETTTACPQHTAAATGHIRGAIALSLAPF